MAEPARQKRNRQPQRNRDDQHETSLLQWFGSFLFWGLLLIAGTLYGSVAMAPKLSTYVGLNDEYVTGQAELVRLERQVHELQKITESLEQDPAILEELARIDLDATRPGEELIPLCDDLTLQSRVSKVRITESDSTDWWYSPFLTAFTSDQRLRTMSLVLVAFTFFQPAQSARFHTGSNNLRGGSSAGVARYGTK